MPAAPWWQPRPALRRFASDLLADELLRQRRRAERVPLPWPDDLALDEDLGVDSLERLALAAALAGALHLHESGIEDYLLTRRRAGEWLDIAQAGLERFSDRLTFRTSGSSGTPKPCVHDFASLQREATFLATLFPGRRRVLCAVPSHHIYGFLFGVLLPRALGLGEDAVVDLRASSPAWLAHGAAPGDLVIGHPDFWQAAARSVPRLPADVVGVTSTAPCPDAVSEAVQATGIARLVHIYGSSETAGIGWRDSHLQPYALMPHWRLEEGSHLLVRTLPDGSRNTVRCQDHLMPEGQGRFRVGPRRDQAVQVGGINVFPSRVTEVLRRHPLVEDAAVRLMRPEEGTRLKAFVVTSRPAGDELLAQLREYIDQQLPAPERPKVITVGARLPRTAEGKPADWTIGG